jgi:hypothetical protein
MSFEFCSVELAWLSLVSEGGTAVLAALQLRITAETQLAAAKAEIFEGLEITE